jgi:hypothetical protein
MQTPPFISARVEAFAASDSFESSVGGSPRNFGTSFIAILLRRCYELLLCLRGDRLHVEQMRLTDWPSADPTSAWRACLPGGQLPVCGQCASVRLALAELCQDDAGLSLGSRPSRKTDQIRKRKTGRDWSFPASLLPENLRKADLDLSGPIAIANYCFWENATGKGSGMEVN